MVQRFILNEVSYFGAGSRKQLPEAITRLGGKKALVVSDKGLIKFGVTKMVTDELDLANIPYEIYSEIKPNPTVTNVKQGVEAFKRAGADLLIAIGGGSSMDTAKGIGIVTTNPEFADIVSLEGCAPTKHKSIPIIAMPTTAGTAAETTINYVIIDEEKQKKMVCVDPNDIPSVAIIDAELMYSLPKNLTAATGMLHYPQVLILDEPFNFLDPTSQSLIKHLLKKYNEEHQATVIISSHNLSHTVDICPRIALLEKGIIIKDLVNENNSAEKELEDYFNVEE